MAFATSEDIASRLGRALGANEEAPVDLLLEGATAIIADTAGKDEDWAPDPVPKVIKLMCVELVVRALANPQALTSMQEGLGAHNYSVRFGQYGILPTPMEERIIRRAVYGRNSGSARANTLANHIDRRWPYLDQLFIDESIVTS